LVVIVDKIYATGEDRNPDCYRNLLIFSDDGGVTWSEAVETPARGIVPDRLLELADGRWILSCHTTEPASRNLVQRLWYSDDQGATLTGPVIVGQQPGLNLCEASILPVEGQTLVAFHRENSGKGWDCFKTISYDNGASWSAPIAFPPATQDGFSSRMVKSTSSTTSSTMRQRHRSVAMPCKCRTFS